MALSQVQPQQEKEKGPSALENAAKALGILGTIGGLGIQGYQAANPTPAASTNIIIGKPKDPFYLDFLANSGVKK